MGNGKCRHKWASYYTSINIESLKSNLIISIIYVCWNHSKSTFPSKNQITKVHFMVQETFSMTCIYNKSCTWRVVGIKFLILSVIMSGIYGGNKRFNGLSKIVITPKGREYALHLSTNSMWCIICTQLYTKWRNQLSKTKVISCLFIPSIY